MLNLPIRHAYTVNSFSLQSVSAFCFSACPAHSWRTDAVRRTAPTRLLVTTSSQNHASLLAPCTAGGGHVRCLARSLAVVVRHAGRRRQPDGQPAQHGACGSPSDSSRLSGGATTLRVT
eukprot:362078-Chlamydomonas_euryale.AAC.5